MGILARIVLHRMVWVWCKSTESANKFPTGSLDYGRTKPYGNKGQVLHRSEISVSALSGAKAWSAQSGTINGIVS